MDEYFTPFVLPERDPVLCRERDKLDGSMVTVEKRTLYARTVFHQKVEARNPPRKHPARAINLALVFARNQSPNSVKPRELQRN